VEKSVRDFAGGGVRESGKLETLFVSGLINSKPVSTMKTLRITLLSLVTIAATSASFAGPGLQYWKSRSAVPAPVAEKPAVKAEKDVCGTMPVTHGRFTRNVKCDAEVAKTAACKAHCGA
jgi:hypothetical protein